MTTLSMQPVYKKSPSASPASNTDDCIKGIMELAGVISVTVLRLFPCIGATERNRDDSSLEKVLF